MSSRGSWTERIDLAKQDVRFAFRTLIKNPGFTAVAVLTLALGIGLNAAIFSVVNGVLLEPLAFPHPDRLVRISQVERANGVSTPGTVSAVNLDDWRARRRVFDDIGGYFYREGMSGTDLTGEGEPQRVASAFITPGFWRTLGVAPLLGRVQRDDEMVRGSNDHVVVLSYDYWKRQFGGAATVIGRRVQLGGESYEIVGVMPATFHYPVARVEMFIPYSTIPDSAIPRLRGVRILQAIGRLNPGVAVSQGAAEMNAITRGLADAYRENKSLDAAEVLPLQDAMVGKVRKSLFVLLGAVGFVLLIAVVNLASLMLARATARERELAIRAALGAERGRIVRQLLTESLMLATLGGIAGLFIAQLGAGLFVRMAAGQLPRAEDVGVDYRVVLFAALVSLIAGTLFGLLPAIKASTPALQQSLREGSRGSTSGVGGLRNALVVAEVAIALMLVVGAGLMTRSFVNLMRVDLGFATDHRLAFDFSISSARNSTSASMRETHRLMLERVRQVPGVIAAGSVRDLPFHGDGEPIGFEVPDHPSATPDDKPRATLMFTSDGFFSAMGVPVLAGRDLASTDRVDAPVVFVVNRALADKYFGGRNPVGQTITLGDTTRYPIVGLVGDVRQGAVDETPAPRIYASVYQIFRVRTGLVVRTQGDPALMTKRVMEAIRSVAPQQTFNATFTLDDAVSNAVARPRLITVLLGLFGAMGLVLGALGLYGVLSYLVNQRRREIGVRLALGAQPRDVLTMVVSRGLALAGAGVVIGLVGALALTRLMQSVLFGVAATDPLTFGGVAVALLIVAAFASWLPARRATRVDPLVALRAD